MREVLGSHSCARSRNSSRPRRQRDRRSAPRSTANGPASFGRKESSRTLLDPPFETLRGANTARAGRPPRRLLEPEHARGRWLDGFEPRGKGEKTGAFRQSRANPGRAGQLDETQPHESRKTAPARPKTFRQGGARPQRADRRTTAPRKARQGDRGSARGYNRAPPPNAREALRPKKPKQMLEQLAARIVRNGDGGKRRRPRVRIGERGNWGRRGQAIARLRRLGYKAGGRRKAPFVSIPRGRGALAESAKARKASPGNCKAAWGDGHGRSRMGANEAEFRRKKRTDPWGPSGALGAKYGDDSPVGERCGAKNPTLQRARRGVPRNCAAGLGDRNAANRSRNATISNDC